MKIKLKKLSSWKIMLGGTIFQIFYALFIFLYLIIANFFNIQIGSLALLLVIIMIYSLIFSSIGIIFIFLFLIKNKIIKKILSIIAIIIGLIGIILYLGSVLFFIPLTIFLIIAGIKAWKE